MIKLINSKAFFFSGLNSFYNFNAGTDKLVLYKQMNEIDIM